MYLSQPPRDDSVERLIKELFPGQTPWALKGSRYNDTDRTITFRGPTRAQAFANTLFDNYKIGSTTNKGQAKTVQKPDRTCQFYHVILAKSDITDLRKYSASPSVKSTEDVSTLLYVTSRFSLEEKAKPLPQKPVLPAASSTSSAQSSVVAASPISQPPVSSTPFQSRNSGVPDNSKKPLQVEEQKLVIPDKLDRSVAEKKYLAQVTEYLSKINDYWNSTPEGMTKDEIVQVGLVLKKMLDFSTSNPRRPIFDIVVDLPNSDPWKKYIQGKIHHPELRTMIDFLEKPAVHLKTFYLKELNIEREECEAYRKSMIDLGGSEGDFPQQIASCDKLIQALRSSAKLSDLKAVVTKLLVGRELIGNAASYAEQILQDFTRSPVSAANVSRQQASSSSSVSSPPSAFGQPAPDNTSYPAAPGGPDVHRPPSPKR